MRDFELTTRWMYFGTFHRVPMVNGYSAFFPNAYFGIRDAVNTSFPTEDTLRRLAGSNVEFLVVMRSAISTEALGSATFDSFVIERVYEDTVGVDVYRLRRID